MVERLRQYGSALRYACDAGLITGLVILSLARIGASMLPLVGWPLHFAIWLGAYKIAYEVLYASAHGRATPPMVMDQAEHDLASRNTWLQALLLVAVVAAARWGGPAMVTVVSIAVGLALPLMLTALTVSHDFLRTIWPGAWIRAAEALRVEYLVAIPACLLATALQGHAAAWLPTDWPKPVAVFTYYFAAHLALVVAFRLVGDGIFRARAELGFEAEPGTPLVDPATRRERALADGIAARIESGDRDGALAELERETSAGASLALNERYRALLLDVGDQARLDAHARRFLGQLLVQGRERPALSLLHDCLQRDPGFLPADAADTERLAQAGLRVGMPHVVLELAARTIAQQPKKRETAAIALGAARMLAAQGERSRAYSLLRGLRERVTNVEVQANLDEAMLALMRPHA